ncbi:hypothetical protein [Streptomyces sp. NPDC020747]|uniref:hypothetical protein n=1 Tax=Streptomyces sp. NPDC020747 TaxID=3365086 RepID=UPI0037B77B33
MSARSWTTSAVARLRAANPSVVVARVRAANPYVVDTAHAALVLFAASLQWMFPDEGDDRLTWQGFLLGAGTAVPLVWRRRSPCPGSGASCWWAGRPGCR